MDFLQPFYASHYFVSDFNSQQIEKRKVSAFASDIRVLLQMRQTNWVVMSFTKGKEWSGENEVTKIYGKRIQILL